MIAAGAASSSSSSWPGAGNMEQAGYSDTVHPPTKICLKVKIWPIWVEDMWWNFLAKCSVPFDMKIGDGEFDPTRVLDPATFEQSGSWWEKLVDCLKFGDTKFENHPTSLVRLVAHEFLFWKCGFGAPYIWGREHLLTRWNTSHGAKVYLFLFHVTICFFPPDLFFLSMYMYSDSKHPNFPKQNRKTTKQFDWSSTSVNTTQRPNEPSLGSGHGAAPKESRHVEPGHWGHEEHEPRGTSRVRPCLLSLLLDQT